MKLRLNVKEPAEYAGVCADTIYTARELNHIRIGGHRAIRTKREWIDARFERYACGTRDARAAGAAGLGV